MLDQLVESRSNNGENTKKNGLLIGTLAFMVLFMLGAWLYSLFAQDYSGLGGSDLELSNLVAPPVPDEEPPPPPEKQPETKAKVEPNVDIRKELIANIDMTPKDPPPISVVKSNVPAMSMTKKTVLGNVNFSSQNSVDANDRGPINANPEGIGSGSKGDGNGPTPAAPPPPPVVAKKEDPPKPPPPAVPKVVSGGVVNGKATSLPKPPYPPAARAVHASGAVSVQVLIDESGRVVSASAVSGHPLLRQAAVSAAQQAHFSPTVLSGQPVKVSGIITYNFVP